MYYTYTIRYIYIYSYYTYMYVCIYGIWYISILRYAFSTISEGKRKSYIVFSVPSLIMKHLRGNLTLFAVFFLLMHSGRGSRRKELIYIYNTADWEPIINAPLSPRSPNEKMDVVMNNGAGPIVDKSLSLYHTDQYSLFQIMFNRALRDPRRTKDPSEATTFIIPYDFASDVAYMSQRPNNNVGFDFRKCPLGPTVTDLLSKSPYFQRNAGRDHLLLVGMNYAMDHYILKPKVCNYTELLILIIVTSSLVQGVSSELYKLHEACDR